MNRQQSNQKILEILHKVVEEKPDYRFIQVLWALDIINIDNNGHIKDRFYEESAKTLRIVQQAITESIFSKEKNNIPSDM